jgi:glycosyltransferase involved in cell wall biosynthesis
MKIGIDAKWLFRGQVSGKVFIQNILPELFKLHPGIEWHIFLDKKDKDFPVPFATETAKVHYVWARFNMLSNLFVLPSYAKQLNLDAVLFQTFSPKGKSFKSIVFIHDVLFKNYPEHFTWKERLYFKPLKWTIVLADRIVTTTEYVSNELRRFHFVKSTQHVDIVPLGIKNIFKSRHQHGTEFLKMVKEKYNLPGEYILFVGRLNSRKNIQGVIKALSLLDDTSISVVIAGDRSWKKAPIRKLTSDKRIRERIIFTGAVTDEELGAIYAMAKIFCFPSFAEGFGLPPLEAMASGIPVIVSDNTAMPEVCDKAALFIDPHDPRTIAEKMNDLLQNDSLYNQKVTEGLHWSSQYSWRRTAEGIMKSIFAAVSKS